jgi:fucose permease
MFVLGVLYLQDVLHYDALETGLAFLPTTVVIGTLSLRYTERLITKFGPRTTLLPGLALIAIGLALFGRAPINGSYLLDVLPAIVPIGVGVGVAFPTLATLAMSGAKEQDAGLASGLVNTTMQVGSALGLALLATLSATRSASLLRQGVDKTMALTEGYQLGFWIGAGFVVVALIVAILVIRPSAKQPTT